MDDQHRLHPFARENCLHRGESRTFLAISPGPTHFNEAEDDGAQNRQCGSKIGNGGKVQGGDGCRSFDAEGEVSIKDGDSLAAFTVWNGSVDGSLFAELTGYGFQSR